MFVGNGSLDFDDFLAMMVKKLHVNPDTELREVFNVFDVDEDGQISVDELYDVLTRLGETISRVQNYIQGTKLILWERRGGRSWAAVISIYSRVFKAVYNYAIDINKSIYLNWLKIY